MDKDIHIKYSSKACKHAPVLMYLYQRTEAWGIAPPSPQNAVYSTRTGSSPASVSSSSALPFFSFFSLPRYHP